MILSIHGLSEEEEEEEEEEGEEEAEEEEEEREELNKRRKEGGKISHTGGIQKGCEVLIVKIRMYFLFTIF